MFQKITEWCQGRHTFFVMLFFISGNVFHYLHRLDATYIAFMTSLMGFVLGHSYKEDKMGSTDAGRQ